MKLHKIELIAIDIEHYGIEDILNQIENCNGFLVKVVDTETIETSEKWSDESPLNRRIISKDELLSELDRLKGL